MKKFSSFEKSVTKNWKPEKHGEIAVGREAMYKGDDVSIVKIDNGIITLKNNNDGKKYKVRFSEFAKNATPFPLKEDAPTNVSGGTGINSPNPNMANIDAPLSVVKRDKFANKEVFDVDDCFYTKCIHGKAKYAKYADYVGSDETGEAIRQYGRANPKSSIIVRNKNTQNMMYLRKINEETGEEIVETEINEANSTTKGKYTPDTVRVAGGYMAVVRTKKDDKAGKYLWKSTRYYKTHGDAMAAAKYKVAILSENGGVDLDESVNESLHLNEIASWIKATITLADGETGYISSVPKNGLLKNVPIHKGNTAEGGIYRFNSLDNKGNSSIIKIDRDKDSYVFGKIDSDGEYVFSGSERKYKKLTSIAKGLDESLNESISFGGAMVGALLAAYGIAAVRGYYEMTRDTYNKLKKSIEDKREIAKREGKGGILTDYSKEINKVVDTLEHIFNKAKIKQ